MRSLITYWAIIGLFNLARLTYQDFKHKCMVDDRINYLMYGISFSLLTQISRPFYFILLVVFIGIAFKKFLDKYKYFGEADSTTLSWIFIGLGVINPFYLMMFAGVLIILSLFNYLILKKYKKEKAQYYHVIFASFLTIVITFSLWTMAL